MAAQQQQQQQQQETSGWVVANNWLQTAINAVVTITDSRYKAQAAKEAAKVQASIDTSTAKTAAQEERSTNMVRNILIVVGGTLGLILAYGVARKLLK